MPGSGGAADQPMAGMTRTIVTICAMAGTLMQALDTTIANVALPYMQGTLSASYDQITWVLTSYVVAAAIMTAPMGWLAGRYGRKRLLVICMIGFTLTSTLCGLATSLQQIVVFRMMQGACGAALVPLSQATMMDIYPPDKRGSAMSWWGMGVMVGPILGPTLGGYLTAYYNWRYAFFVNLPFGIAATLGMIVFMPRDQLPRKMPFDWAGFAVLSLALGGLQIALDRGEELDWLASPTIVVCIGAAVLGLFLFIVHMMTARRPFIPRSVFADRNFNGGLITMFCVAMTMLASSALLAPYLEDLANHPVEQAGLLMAPRGFGTMASMLIAGRLTSHVDSRLLMFAGYVTICVSIVMTESWTPAVSDNYLILTTVIQGAGTGLIFVPLQVVAFGTLAPRLRAQGASLFALMRNMGSAIGVSASSAILDHQTHYEHAVLSQFITPFSRALQAGGTASQALNPHTAAGAAMLDSIVGTQAQIVAYIDVYKFLLLASIPAVFSLFLMRRPRLALNADDHQSVMD